jgi:hypothetical protein
VNAAAVDAGPRDSGADAGPDAATCVGSWPTAGPDPILPSLPVSPRILWTRALNRSFLQPSAVALAGDRLAMVGMDTFFLLDRQGRILNTLRGTQADLLSPPVADARGSFYFAGLGVYSVSGGSAGWMTPFGPAGPGVNGGARLVLSPSAIYTVGTDGVFYQLAFSTGTPVFARLVASTFGGIGPGVGDVISVGIANPPGLYDAQSGQFRAGLKDRAGNRLGMWIAGFEVGIVAIRVAVVSETRSMFSIRAERPNGRHLRIVRAFPSSLPKATG